MEVGRASSEGLKERLKMTRYLWMTVTAACLLLGQAPAQAYTVPEIVAKAKPAVVKIVTIDEKGSTSQLSTGFFISSDGQAVTNRHVIEGAASIAAVNNNGAVFLFERVVVQPVGVDLVILKFRATDVPFLTLGKSTTAVEGQKVIVIGNPTGLTGTASDGIISAFRENRSLLQITAPISPGWRGSPVMDEDGQVIGVATLLIVEGQNLNFAIAVEEVSAALQQPPSQQVIGSGLPTPTPAIDATVYYKSGVASLGKLDYTKAIGDFTEAIRLDPNYTHAYTDRGAAYSKKGDYAKAISDFSEAIRLDSNFALAYYNRGLAYANKGNYDKAISDYTEAIRLDPNYTQAYTNRGAAYAEKHNHAEAISDFTEAIRLDPNDALAYFNRGRTYYAQGKLRKAISDYSEAIRLDPNYTHAYTNRGAAYSKKGDYAEAISDFTEAIRLDPNDALAYNNREIAYLRTGKRAKANADFATAKRLKAGR